MEMEKAGRRPGLLLHIYNTVSLLGVGVDGVYCKEVLNLMSTGDFF